LALTGHSFDRVWLSSATTLSNLRRSEEVPAQWILVAIIVSMAVPTRSASSATSLR
jgi:hypothetical protein